MMRQFNPITEQQRIFENKLTPEREVELKAHFKQCPNEKYLNCPLCCELYENIGHDAYLELFKDLAPEDRVSPVL